MPVLDMAPLLPRTFSATIISLGQPGLTDQLKKIFPFPAGLAHMTTKPVGVHANHCASAALHEHMTSGLIGYIWHIKHIRGITVLIQGASSKYPDSIMIMRKQNVLSLITAGIPQ